MSNEKLLNSFFDLAIKYNASDLFLVSGSHPALKVLGEIGIVKNYPVLESKEVEGFLLEIMTQEEKKHFEENLDIDIAYEYEDKARFRVNAFVGNKGVGIVFRLVPKNIKTLDELGIPREFKKVARMRSGLVLITGATGSGKTTTLAALIDLINETRKSHIISIEDPIEYIHQNRNSIISQREVGVHTKDFTTGLKAALREAADVIVIGEMRDPETMELAIQASETGMLVLGTMHTRGVVSVPDKIIGSFMKERRAQIRSQISRSIKSVLWQVLLKRKDQESRIVATELLFGNYAISNMIRKDQAHQLYSAIETGASEGMHTMEQSLKELVASNKVTKEEVKNLYI